MTPRADLRSITEIAPLLEAGTLSPVHLVRTCLARIDARPELNAFITVMRENALAEARAAEIDIAAGNYIGPLHGVPVSVKDLIDIAGTPTTAGSALPPRYPRVDAPIVTRLRGAGAIIIGKTNLHEFAFGTTSEESAFGPVRHPLDPSRSPGGSSGGAAVALVEGMCFGSVGTDTGGSVRIPSAACGTVGLKPALGELSCEGIVALAGTLDHVGPLTRSVADAALLLQAMRDSSVRGRRGRGVHPGPRGTRAAGGAGVLNPAERRAFGVPEAYFCSRLDPEVRLALARTRETLARAGHEIRTVDVEHAARTADIYLHIVLPEASQYHALALETHAERYSPGVRLRLEMGRYVLAEDYVRAQSLRRVLTQAVDRALESCDALLLPTLPIPAPTLGVATVEIDGMKEPVRGAMLRLTQLFNLTGHPAIALPAGRTRDGWPVSMQLIGQQNDTDGLLDLAEAVAYMIGGDGSVGGGTG
jgi:aspartyl-tRNA(Asn)/glutamyl-tRNA(Gln) amidotransferase subunit A